MSVMSKKDAAEGARAHGEGLGYRHPRLQQPARDDKDVLDARRSARVRHQPEL